MSIGALIAESISKEQRISVPAVQKLCDQSTRKAFAREVKDFIRMIQGLIGDDKRKGGKCAPKGRSDQMIAHHVNHPKKKETKIIWTS